ncbi:unnamed protein product [Brassica napus]|uniref:(rape) hypothetical protein n=1 Tax=Brassica napus TaxID=3708 RepID=A0A816JQG2_BRANA|nr:unnamed protein product [Brassica napus]
MVFEKECGLAEASIELTSKRDRHAYLAGKYSSRKTLITKGSSWLSGYDHVRGAWMRSSCRISQHESNNLLLQKEVTSILQKVIKLFA